MEAKLSLLPKLLRVGTMNPQEEKNKTPKHYRERIGPLEPKIQNYLMNSAPSMHAKSDQRMEVEAPDESPQNEESPPAESGEATTRKLPTDLTRKPPYNLDGVTLTLEPCPSSEKQAPAPTLTGNQRTEREGNERPTDKIGTNEESTGTNVVPAPSHMNNREKLKSSSPRNEGSSFSDIPEISQSGAISKKGGIK